MGNMSSKNTINDESYQGLKATSGAAHVSNFIDSGKAIQTRTFSALVDTRKRITFSSNHGIKMLFGTAVPDLAAQPTDTGLLMTINASSAAAADIILNAGILADHLTDDISIVLIPLNEPFIITLDEVDNPIITVDIIAYNGTGSAAAAVPISGFLGGQ